MADHTEPPQSKRNLLAELRRRHVVRAAIVYALAVWALAQGISQLSPAFGLVPRVTLWFVIACVIGFPFWIAFAWFFKFTTSGIARENEVEKDAATIRRGGRHLDYWIIGILAIAVVLLLTNQLVLQRGKTLREFAVTPAAAKIPAKSIAVLPFENLSNDKNNAYFVAGMQDLILTKLADIGDLKVIARTSTQSYGSHPQNLKTVGQQLGVATLLEGSVQKAGNQVLVNVQLIDAATDAHIWAQSYRRTLTNVFSVEGEVATQIAASLNAKLSPAQAAQLAAAPSANQAAMDLFLRAEYQANKSNTNYSVGDTSGWRAAIPLYRQAIAKDPGFALAYARLSYVESDLAFIAGENVAALAAQARTDAEAAQKLAPHAVATLLALGYCEYWGKGDYTAALKTFKAALAARPNDSATLAAIGYVERKQGNIDAALDSLQQAFALDPRNSMLAGEIGTTYMLVSRYPEAGNWFQRAQALDPTNLSAKSEYPYAILLSDGDVARALAAAGGDDPAMQGVRVNLLTYQRKFAQALVLLEAIPDTPDNFLLAQGLSKALQQAGLYRLLGDAARARPLYQKVLTALRAQLAKSESESAQNDYLAYVWNAVADAELGLGQTKAGLAAIASAQAANEKFEARHPLVFAYVMELNAGSYAQAHRPDLAVPLLARALTLPAIGSNYSPAMLWLDPAWDPIRHDPRFQALLKKYAKYKPAVTYPIPPAS